MSPWRSTLPQEALPTLVGSFGSVSSVITAPLLWVSVHAKFCLCLPSLESLFLSILWKACNQILLALKARFPGDFQSLCWIPRLGNLMWGSEPSQQCENFFGITVLQSVDHPPSGYGIWFYRDCAPPTISLWLLCLWMWGIFLVGSSVLLLLVVPTAGCSFGVLARELSTRLLLHCLELETIPILKQIPPREIKQKWKFLDLGTLSVLGRPGCLYWRS